MKVMRLLKLCFLIYILIGYQSFCVAQTNSNNEDPVLMLKNFYTAYNTAWIRTKDNMILIKKIDSLERKYCSKGFIIKLKKEFKAGGLDHDLLTNDEGADETSLQSLSIKESAKPNIYIVSYHHDTLTPDNKPINKLVVFHVRLINEKGNYKIDGVW